MSHCFVSLIVPLTSFYGFKTQICSCLTWEAFWFKFGETVFDRKQTHCSIF